MWFTLIEQDLYCIYYLYIVQDYKTKNGSFSGMHNLSGVLLKEENLARIDGFNMHCFSLIYSNKTRFYYCISEFEYKEWVKKIKLVTNQEDLNETYEIGEKIGQGKFGVVKKCVNKISSQKAAIKILSKKEMSEDDIELVFTEIEILKISQHPNVIRLYEVFQNNEYIYIGKKYNKI